MKLKTGLWMVAAGVALVAVTHVPTRGQNRISPVTPAPTQTIAAAPGVAKEALANPLYAAWKGQEEKTATFNRTEQISGGAPVPGGNARPATNSTVQFKLSEFTPDQAVIKVATSTAPAESLTLVEPAKLMPDDPAFPKPAGKEELKIGDKTYTCAKYTYTTNSKAEMGRDGQGMRGSVTVWVADGVPGGIVQRHVSLTIRVTYDVTDTLMP